MRIQRIDNAQFGALIKLKNPAEIMIQVSQTINNLPPNQRGICAGATSLGSSSLGASASVVGSATQTAATTSDVIGSAYMLKASGVDSFGIVPSAMAKSGPYLTPATVASSEQNPVTAGSIFSGLGAWFHRFVKFTDERTPRKIPS